MAMANREPKAEKNLDGYGAPVIPWRRVAECLDKGITEEPGSGGPDRHTFWLATVRPDGRPHVMPLGVLQVDDAFYFTAGAGTRKAKNIAHNSNCVLTIATHDFDLVMEGNAMKVTDPARVSRIAEIFKDQGWPASVSDSGDSLTGPYSAPSAGPPPWDVYEVVPEIVFALGTAEPYGATSFHF